MFSWEKEVELSVLLGSVLVSAEKVDDKEIHFKTESGKHYLLYHEQDCCESVKVDDICGELSELVGSPRVQAEEISSEGTPAKDAEYPDDSSTWTFYRLASVKGTVVIRFYGTSNGYYSERVSFVEVTG